MCSLGLAACSSFSFHPKTTDLAKRWSLIQANEACSAAIERKRWGSLAAILTYEEQQPDHGYAACMKRSLAGKMK
jgi:hypothetical protein